MLIATPILKLLLKYAGVHLTDEEFFPDHIKAHIDRGAVMLEQEQRYGSDFLIHLSSLDKAL